MEWDAVDRGDFESAQTLATAANAGEAAAAECSEAGADRKVS